MQVHTPAAFDFWCYVLLTWHPKTGLQLYGNSNLKTSLAAPQNNAAPAPVYQAKPNVAVGRGLKQSPDQMCGLVYVSSIAVFKQYLTQEWVNKVFGFFWKNSEYTCFFCKIFISVCLTGFKCNLFLIYKRTPHYYHPVNTVTIPLFTGKRRTQIAKVCRLQPQ